MSKKFRDFFRLSYNPASKKNFISFRSYMAMLGLAPALFAVLAVFVYAVIFISFSRETLLAAVLMQALILLASLVIFSPLTNYAITQRLSNRINYWMVSGLDEKGRTELLKAVLSYPRKKAMETYGHFFICSVVLAFLYRMLLHVDFFVTVLFFATCLVSSFIAMIFSLYIADAVCSDLAVRIAGQGISQEAIMEKKYFGIPLSVSFILYVIIPIVLAGMLSFLTARLGYTPVVIHENGKIASLYISSAEKLGFVYREVQTGTIRILRMVFVSAADICLLFFTAILYFRKLSKSSRQMSDAFEYMMSFTSEEIYFPVDFATELSYTLYLINRTILYFRDLIRKTSDVNARINQSALELSGVTKETESTAITQSTNVEEILATMMNTSTLSKTIEVKVNEVITVANKTSTDINENFKRINENLFKMQEITDSNQNTIRGIQTLANKVNGVKEIVNLIDSMAEQTKIIAFNAELEACNTEDDENNFVNVAIEIRNLADRTIDLTSQIKSKIVEIQLCNKSLIDASKMCMKKINDGNTLTSSLQNKLSGVQKAAIVTTEDAKEIGNLVLRQTSAFDQIVAALSGISKGVKAFEESSRTITLTMEKLKTDSARLASINTGAKE